jgi:hypothetical protein
LYLYSYSNICCTVQINHYSLYVFGLLLLLSFHHRNHPNSTSKAETTQALNNTTSSSSNGGKPTPPAPAPTNAWARPLQPKRGATAPPPGMGLPSKSSTATSSSSSSSSSNSALLLQHRERLLHLSLTLIGETVILHQTNGAIIEGIFHTFTPFSSLPTDQRNKYVLKEILIRKQSTNGTDDILKDGVTLIVPTSKVVCVHAKNVSTDLTNDDNNNSSNSSMNGGTMLTSLGAAQGTGSDGDDAFATDTQISNSNDVRNQDLVAAGNAWTTGGNSSNSNSIGNSSYRNQALGASGGGGGGGPPLPTNSRAAALAGNSKSNSGTNNQQGGAATTSSNMSGSIGQWDQFKANKELFNVDATFDENLYTTELDTSNMDAKKVAEAKRIAREIESTTTTNIHLAEERGFKVETDFDEEDLYSGVLTKDGKQRHEVKISKKTTNNEDGPNTSTAAPRKTMNYAAAAAKADTSKTAPPGFLASAPTTTTTTTNDNIDKEENKAESPTVVVTPEKKKTKEDTKSTQNKPTKKEEEEKNPSKDDSNKKQDVKEKTAGTSKKDANVPSTPNDKKDVSKDETSKPTEDKNSGESEEDKRKEKEEAKKPTKLNANAKSFSFNPTAKTFTPSFGGANNNPAPQQHPQHAATTDPNMQMYGGGHPMQPPHYMQAGPMGQPGTYYFSQFFCFCYCL